MGALVSMFEGVGKFFDAFVGMLSGMVRFVGKLIMMVTTPLRAVVFLALYIICVPIYAVTVFLYLIWGFPVLIDIQFINYYFWVQILWDLLYTIFIVTLFLAIAAIAVVLWITDLLTFGAVRWLTRTENALDSWYTRPNFAFGNIANRFLIAQLPCANGFKPDKSEFLCERQISEEPSFCPQSEVYRIYNGVYKDNNRSQVYDKFVPSAEFYASTSEEREALVRKFYRSRQLFLSSCKKNMKSYESFSKTLCQNTDKLALEDPEMRPVVKRLCQQIYCDPEATNKTEWFCASLASTGKYTGEKKSSMDDLYANTAKTLLYIIAVILVGTTTLMMFQMSGTSTEAGTGTGTGTGTSMSTPSLVVPAPAPAPAPVPVTAV
jgi:hypothetical protein